MTSFPRVVFPLVMALVLLAAPVAWSADPAVLMMATTTSTDDTGLLPELAKAFKAKTGIELRWVATGTGKALEIGKNCDADVLFVHAPAAEKKFMDEGAGLKRSEVMYNDFVIVGPKADPLKLKGKDAASALKILAKGQGIFVSRGDKSGTHMAELALWKAAGLETPDKQAWYVSTGQGMLQSLRMAVEKGGYCLTDRGTYIKFELSPEGAKTAIAVEGDPSLRNQYSVVTLNPAKCPKIKQELAESFAKWIVSPEGQQCIAAFKLEGKQLFFPNAAK